MKSGDDGNSVQEDQIAVEASAWVMGRLSDEYDPTDPIPDPHKRQQAFFDWLAKSPTHRRVLREMQQIGEFLKRANLQFLAELPELTAGVVRFPGTARLERRRRGAQRPRWRLTRLRGIALAAGIGALALAAVYVFAIRGVSRQGPEPRDEARARAVNVIASRRPMLTGVPLTEVTFRVAP